MLHYPRQSRCILSFVTWIVYLLPLGSQRLPSFLYPLLGFRKGLFVLFFIRQMALLARRQWLHHGGRLRLLWLSTFSASTRRDCSDRASSTPQPGQGIILSTFLRSTAMSSKRLKFPQDGTTSLPSKKISGWQELEGITNRTILISGVLWMYSSFTSFFNCAHMGWGSCTRSVPLWSLLMNSSSASWVTLSVGTWEFEVCKIEVEPFNSCQLPEDGKARKIVGTTRQLVKTEKQLKKLSLNISHPLVSNISVSHNYFLEPLILIFLI